MTPKQKSLYFREWSAAKRAGQLTEADRHTLHIEALGYDASSARLTNDELDKILAAFRAISQPANLNSQLRQLDQPRQRHLARIRDQIKTIALFREWPESYLARILQDRFSADAITDLTNEIYSRPRARASAAGPAGETITDSHLPQIRNTLARCLSQLRQRWNHQVARGDRPQVHLHSPLCGRWHTLTEHDLCTLAAVPCRCAACRHTADPDPSHPSHPSHSPALAATTEPF